MHKSTKFFAVAGTQIEVIFDQKLPYLCRFGEKISNVHSLHLDIELNDWTTPRRIFHQQCLQFPPAGRLDSKYV